MLDAREVPGLAANVAKKGNSVSAFPIRAMIPSLVAGPLRHRTPAGVSTSYEESG